MLHGSPVMARQEIRPLGITHQDDPPTFETFAMCPMYSGQTVLNLVLFLYHGIKSHGMVRIIEVSFCAIIGYKKGT